MNHVFIYELTEELLGWILVDISIVYLYDNEFNGRPKAKGVISEDCWDLVRLTDKIMVRTNNLKNVLVVQEGFVHHSRVYM